MTTAALEQFTQRVRNIYGEAQDCEAIAKEILTQCQCFADKRQSAVLEQAASPELPRWSEEDVILITY
ncbi:MAG: alpha-amylase, partial [Pseudomonadota bacterium]|nr:alpha-amylase [Pseudomonadota bacterium]